MTYIPEDDPDNFAAYGSNRLPTYREGYLDALDDALIALYGFTELSTQDVVDILAGVKEEFENRKQ